MLHCFLFIQADLTSNQSKLIAIAKLTCMHTNVFKINTTSLDCKHHRPQNNALMPIWVPPCHSDRAGLQGQVSKWPALALPFSPSVHISRRERTIAVLEISPFARRRPCAARDHGLCAHHCAPDTSLHACSSGSSVNSWQWLLEVKARNYLEKW